MAKSLYDRMSEVPEEERKKLDKILRAKGYGDDIQQSRNRRKRPSKIIKKSTTPAGDDASPAPSVAKKTTATTGSAVSRKTLPRSNSASATKKNKKKKQSKSALAELNILFILKLLRVVKLRKGSFSARFIKKFDIEYTEALRVIQLQLEIIEGKAQDIESLMARMGCRDTAIMQALIDLMLLYDEEFVNQFVDKFYDDPGRNINGWESDVLQLYSELYAVYPFRNEVCGLMKSMVSYMSTYSSDSDKNPYISARDVDVYFRTIFEMLFMRLHWLFCFYLGIKLDTEDPDIAKHINAMLSKLKKTARKKRKVSSVKDKNESSQKKKDTSQEKKESSADKASDEETPDSLDDITGINPDAAQKDPVHPKEDVAPFSAEYEDVQAAAEKQESSSFRDIGVTYFINCYNTPSSVMGESTGLYDINHRTDRVLHLSFIFKKFVEQFSFIFITNKIKYSDGETEYKMHSYYNEISRFENDMENYYRIVESWHETYNKEVNTKGKNYISSAGRIDSIERQRQNSGNIIRKAVSRYLVRISGTISAIIGEIEKNSDAVHNSSAVIKFDGKIEKDKIVNAHSIYESFIIINAFVKLFIKEIEPPGSLSGAISVTDELPFINDPVRERREKEKERLDRAERELAERKKAEEERLEREKEEAERAELERAEKEREKRLRDERDRIEKEKAELAKAARRKSEMERVAREREEIEREKLLAAENEKRNNEKHEGAGQEGEKYKVAAESTASAAPEDANPVNSINHAELWQKAVREKIVLQDRAVNEYIDIGRNIARDTSSPREVAAGGTYLKPSEARNSAYSAGFKPYMNYQYQDVVRRVMEFEIVLTDFIKDVLVSRYGERWQSIIARNNKEIKDMLDRENELVKHRGIEYNILEMLNIGQKFNIILNDLLWGDFKNALGLDKNDKSEKTIFQKRSTQIISLRNDVMHLKTVDNTKKDIGFGAISELSDCIKKYGFRKKDGSSGSNPGRNGK